MKNIKLSKTKIKNLNNKLFFFVKNIDELKSIKNAKIGDLVSFYNQKTIYKIADL